MAIRAIWGFDHLPQSRTLGAAGSGYGIAYSGYGIVVDAINTSWVEAYIQNGGLLCDWGGRGDFPVRLRFPLAGLSDNVSPKSFIAFTITRATYNVSLGDLVIVSLGTTIPLVLASDFVHVLDERNQIEICIDRVKKRLVVYVNNKVKRVINNPTAVDNFSTNSMYLGSTGIVGGAGIPIGRLFFRDWIFIDDTQDDTPCQRPGISRTANQAIASASSATWTTTAASILASITTLINASLITPLATSNPTALGPLSFKITPATVDGYEMKAMSFVSTINRTGGAPGSAELSVRAATGNGVVAKKALSTAMVASSLLAVITKLPNNTSISQIGSADFDLTPAL